MRWCGLLVVLGLSACSLDLEPAEDAPWLPEGWTEAEPAEARLGVAPGLSFTQEPLVPGDSVLFVVNGAAPNDTVRFLSSLAGTGAGPCITQLGGLCVDLLGPVNLLGTAVADGAGTAELTFTVPLGAPQIFLYTQAVIDRGAGSVGTNTITAPVLAGSLDVDGDGFCGGSTCADPALLPGDCSDDHPGVNPGVTAPEDVPYWDGVAWSFDYDCDGVEVRAAVGTYSCTANGGSFLNCPHTNGWTYGVPACGQAGTWGEGCTEFPILVSACFEAATYTQVQRCL